MNHRQTVELYITVLVVSAYTALVFIGRVPADGFIALVMYIVKKFLDSIEAKTEKPKEDQR